MPPARSAVWLNKRALDSLELPVPHSFNATSQGWEIAFSASGAIVATFTHGGQQRINTSAGDKLTSAGEDLYFVPKA